MSKRVASPKPGGDSAAKPKTGPIARPAPATGGQPPAVPAGKTARMKRPGKGGKGTQKQKAVKREEQELEPITAFPRGVSLGVKFAAFTAAVVALFMALQGFLTFSIALRRINEQITEQGVSIVATLEKAIDRGFWVQPPEAEEDKDPRRPRRAEVGRAELVADWDRRLKDLVESSGGKIRSVSILEADRGGLHGLSQYPPTSLAFREGPSEDAGDIKITDGRLGEDRVRRFEKAIALGLEREDAIDRELQALGRLEEKDAPEAERIPILAKLRDLTGVKDGKDHQAFSTWRDEHPRPMRVGEEGARPSVAVFVDASRLDALRSELWQRIAAVTACGALAGVIFTVLIAAVLTGPVRTLEQDLRLVAGGDLAHQTTVGSRDEIGALAHVFNIMTRNLQTAQNNAVERKSFERELSICKEIQEKLLPERIPAIPGYDIQSHYRSAKEVGGDYYDFIVIDQTHLGIIVADVAGKGVPGAMVMTMARSLVRLASVRNVSPGDTFKKVNRILAKDIRRGMFVTAAYMVLNVKTRKLKVASAGHNPVLLFRAATGELEQLKPNGIALGFDKGTIFDQHIKEVEVQLETGDRIVSYTDGVNEAMDADGEEFGDEKFHAVVKENARRPSKDFVASIVAALDAHRGKAEQSDDITITTLAVTEAAGGAAQVVAEPETTSDGEGAAEAAEGDA